jgi:hypothetical protein
MPGSPVFAPVHIYELDLYELDPLFVKAAQLQMPSDYNVILITEHNM